MAKQRAGAEAARAAKAAKEAKEKSLKEAETAKAAKEKASKKVRPSSKFPDEATLKKKKERKVQQRRLQYRPRASGCLHHGPQRDVPLRLLRPAEELVRN